MCTRPTILVTLGSMFRQSMDSTGAISTSQMTPSVYSAQTVCPEPLTPTNYEQHKPDHDHNI